MQERILLTGSHGFLGKALSLELSKTYEVIPLARDWVAVPEVDYIYHLGSYGNMHHQQDRAEIFKANVQRTFDLLEATKDMPYKKFVYVSSSSVNLPVQTLYSASKKAAEGLCSAYYDKPIAIVRPYSVTGIGEQVEHLIPVLIKAAFEGTTVDLVLAPRHDYIDIEDVVREIINAKIGTICELGSGKSYYNLQIMRIVEEITGKIINMRPHRSIRSYDTDNWVSPQRYGIKPLKQSIGEQVTEYKRKMGI